MIKLFTVYFLILMLLGSIILIFIDSRDFKKNQRIGEARKARFVGIVYIAISVILFAVNSFR